MSCSFRISPALLLGALLLFHSAASAATYRAVGIVTGEQATELDQRYADLLANRIRSTGATVQFDAQDTPARDQLRIYFGVLERHPALADLCRRAKVPAPTDADPGAEGFVLTRVPGPKDTTFLLAAATDSRGLLYAAGEILRHIATRPGSIDFPDDLALRSAPSFRYRGTLVGQGATITQLTGARAWSDAEWQQVVLDYALAGANTFEIGMRGADDEAKGQFIKAYGLDTLVHVGPNTGSGPPEWQALEAIGRKGYLCLSVPEARSAILNRYEEQFKNGPAYDYVRFYSGDGGGCECERCAPYGKTYIRMCADIAAIVHRYHPETKIFATQQKLTNAGDQAIFDYLVEAPRPWLTALAYGPGSNAMSWQPGRRQDHRMALFHYPAFGPTDGYLREMLHQLPPQQSIVFFTDLTHWVYSEYGLVDYRPQPDLNDDTPPPPGRWVYETRPAPALAMVYDRRTFHARPAYYYWIFQETERYGDGDVTYSEGHHDHFNQWMWQRLLWNPHTPLEDVIDEYCRVWFGPDAAPFMVRALLQLEDNLSTPIAENPGIEDYLGLCRRAGAVMPEHLKRTNYLWRQHLQKALLDQYIQLRERRQRDLQTEIEDRLGSALRTKKLAPAFAKAQHALDCDIETPQMKRIKTEAGQLGEESNALFGVRSEGYFNLDHDFIGLGWLAKQVRDAVSADEHAQRSIAEQIVHYEDPGDGNFYDDAGDPGRSPHLTHGWPYDEGGVADAARPSQRTMAFSTTEQKGVTFSYHDLDPQAHYRVRFTFVRPRYLPRFADKQPQKTQSVFADGLCLAKDIELPEYDPHFFEYDLPTELTRDGDLELWLEKSPGIGEGTRPEVEIWRNTGGWGTLVSEVWLQKVK